jgi:hypothetical protein
MPSVRLVLPVMCAAPGRCQPCLACPRQSPPLPQPSPGALIARPVVWGTATSLFLPLLCMPSHGYESCTQGPHTKGTAHFTNLPQPSSSTQPHHCVHAPSKLCFGNLLLGRGGGWRATCPLPGEPARHGHNCDCAKTGRGAPGRSLLALAPGFPGMAPAGALRRAAAPRGGAAAGGHDPALVPCCRTIIVPLVLCTQLPLARAYDRSLRLSCRKLQA